jgi:nucleoid-associated protein YgaU
VGLEKALITNTVSGDQIPVLFNPEEYTVNKSVNFAQTGVPGLSAPIIQFVNGGLETLAMELFLDTYEEHREGNRVRNRAGDDVRVLVRAITGLMAVDPTTHAPPVLLFTWGSSLSFTCVLAQAQQRFTMFMPDGTPVRARVNVTFNEFRNVDLEAKEVKRETADYSKLHEVVQGETLSAIAWRTYGDPAVWRPIALRNDLDDPWRLEVGARLVVPQLPFRDPESGEVYA